VMSWVKAMSREGWQSSEEEHTDKQPGFTPGPFLQCSHWGDQSQVWDHSKEPLLASERNTSWLWFLRFLLSITWYWKWLMDPKSTLYDCLNEKFIKLRGNQQN
jgi:hypothetical protein